MDVNNEMIEAIALKINALEKEARTSEESRTRVFLDGKRVGIRWVCNLLNIFGYVWEKLDEISKIDSQIADQLIQEYKGMGKEGAKYEEVGERTILPKTI